MNKNIISNNGLIPDDIPQPDDTQIVKVVSEGQKYMDTHVPFRTSYMRLLFEQAKYISPFLWGTQLIVLMISLIISSNLPAPDYNGAREVLFLVAPIIAIFAVPELFKDVFFEMSEMETSCKNSGGVILIMRLIIVGLLNVVAITIFSAILASNWSIRFISLLLFALVSCNCVNIINLLFIRVFQIKRRVSALSLSLLSAVIVYIFPTKLPSISYWSEAVWIAIFIATAIVLACQLANEIPHVTQRRRVITIER